MTRACRRLYTVDGMAIVINSKTKLTYEDYALLPDDGKIHEIIEGEHYMTPAPETYHQTISRRIQFQLYTQIEERGLGYVFDAPTDVQLSEIDIVQPDLLVIVEERKSIISPSRIIGPPDLVIEILSKSGQDKDRRLKLDLYQKAAVPEYWLVDPQSQTVHQYLLEKARYRESGQHHGDIRFDRIAGIRVDLRKVW